MPKIIFLENNQKIAETELLNKEIQCSALIYSEKLAILHRKSQNLGKNQLLILDPEIGKLCEFEKKFPNAYV